MFVFDFLSKVRDIGEVVDGEAPIYFQVADGRYLSATPDGEFTLQEGIGAWESFTLERRDDDNFAIKTVHGKFLKALEDIDEDIQVEDYVGGWEQFQLQPEDDGEAWAVKTAHETFLRSELDDGKLKAQAGVGDTEKFKIGLIKAPDVDLSGLEGTKIGIRTAHDSYIRALDEGGVDASENLGPWESYLIIPQDDGLFAFETCHGTYLRMDDGGNLNQSEEVNAWECFDIIEHGDGLAFKTSHNTYLSCDGEALTMKNYRGPNETFKLFYGSTD